MRGDLQPVLAGQRFHGQEGRGNFRVWLGLQNRSETFLERGIDVADVDIGQGRPLAYQANTDAKPREAFRAVARSMLLVVGLGEGAVSNVG